MKAPNVEYLRSTIFGIEDSLVSTTGLIAGLSVGSDNKDVVLLGGIVAIVIEAVSMGAGEYLSDDAVQELEKLKRHRDRPLVSGALMFTSYLLAGAIPLSPVVFFDYPTSLLLTMLFALSGLFLLGFIKGRLLRSHPWRSGTKILVVGGLATVLGLIVGLIFRLN
ncbi:VIT1/CCC1 transporter family protein [Candidatus Saccharibacteria bacterium]|nr:VIT1/CCC1 transporter family protein [Candidatus Saccharibacteria bacterium]